jgi:hypothetical protein
MGEIVQNATDGLSDNPYDLIDFIVTAGDNMYPLIPEYPTEWEFDRMLDLFRKTGLKDQPVYAVRGNHDCKYDW